MHPPSAEMQHRRSLSCPAARSGFRSFPGRPPAWVKRRRFVGQSILTPSRLYQAPSTRPRHEREFKRRIDSEGMCMRQITRALPLSTRKDLSAPNELDHKMVDRKTPTGTERSLRHPADPIAKLNALIPAQSSRQT